MWSLSHSAQHCTKCTVDARLMPPFIRPMIWMVSRMFLSLWAPATNSQAMGWRHKYVTVVELCYVHWYRWCLANFYSQPYFSLIEHSGQCWFHVHVCISGHCLGLSLTKAFNRLCRLQIHEKPVSTRAGSRTLQSHPSWLPLRSKPHTIYLVQPRCLFHHRLSLYL